MVAHWSECVAEDQREACINPMCQSGKNQAQLGSRTVELLGEEGGGGGVTASRRWEDTVALKSREGPADTFYCQPGTLFYAAVKGF